MGDMGAGISRIGDGACGLRRKKFATGDSGDLGDIGDCGIQGDGAADAIGRAISSWVRMSVR